MTDPLDFRKPKGSGVSELANPEAGATRLYVGPARLYVGTTRLYVGAARSYVGSARLYVGAARSYVGSARLYVGPARLYVGPARLYVGAARSYVGPARLYAGAGCYWTFSRAQAVSGRPIKTAVNGNNPFTAEMEHGD